MIKVCFCATRNLYNKLAIIIMSLWSYNPNTIVYLCIEDDYFLPIRDDRIKVINVLKQDLDILPTNPNLKRFCTYMSLIRNYLPLILKDEDKVISIDCDVVFNGSIEEVWNWDLRDNYVAAVPEFNKQWDEETMRYNDPYVNAGFVIMNLKLMREHHIVEQLIDFMNVVPVKWPDQDALNYICRGHIMLLPFKYNSTIFTGLAERPIVIHGTPIKPWDEDEINYILPIWRYYEEMYASEYSTTNSGENLVHE